MKRFDERELRDCDGDWFSTGMVESSNGKWCLFIEVEKQNELLKEMAEALEKLSRLGNEPYLGNSVGNVIAQDALQKYHEQEATDGNPKT